MYILPVCWPVLSISSKQKQSLLAQRFPFLHHRTTYFPSSRTHQPVQGQHHLISTMFFWYLQHLFIYYKLDSENHFLLLLNFCFRTSSMTPDITLNILNWIYSHTFATTATWISYQSIHTPSVPFCDHFFGFFHIYFHSFFFQYSFPDFKHVNCFILCYYQIINIQEFS